MSVIPIQTQIGPGASIPAGLESVTAPLYPPQSLLFRLRNFAPEVYQLTQSSHLFRLLGVLLGDMGGEGLQKQALISRLRSVLTSTHFLDMDAFWGALFNLNRGSTEGLPYNPITGQTLNPYTDAVPRGIWNQAHQSDSHYRSRIYAFAHALSYGASPVGIKKVAEAVLNMPVDLYETFQSTPAVYQAQIVPHGVVSQADIYNLHNILGQIKPANSIITITQGFGQNYTPVTLAQAWASNNYWEIDALIVPGASSLFSSTTSRPRYAFTNYQGEIWTLNSSFRSIGSQAWDFSGNLLSSTDFEHYSWPDGTYTNFSPDLSVEPAWLADLGKLAQGGASMINPLNAASQALFDGMPANALQSLLNNSSLVSQTTSNRYWSTPARFGTDQTQDVVTYSFDQPHLLTQIAFQVANYPHTATLWMQDPPSGTWTAVYTYTNTTSSPVQFTDPTISLQQHIHPQHAADDAWVPVSVRVSLSSVQNMKIVLQRNSSYGPLDIYGNPAAYSLGVRDFVASAVIDTTADLPIGGGKIDATTNLTGDQVTYKAHIADPNKILNTKNNVVTAALATTLTGGTSYTAIPLTLTNQIIVAGSYIVLGTQQIGVPSTVSGTGTVSVASGSNGGNIVNIATWASPSAGVLAISSTSGINSSGQAIVQTSSGYALINYTSTSGGNTLTGCTLVSGIGTLTTGGTVTNPVATDAFTPSGTHSAGEIVTIVNPLWKCSPQPSSNSVVSYYFDTRNSSGTAQVIDTLYVEPTHTGVTANLYWSNDIPVGGVASDTTLPVTTTGTLVTTNQGLSFISTVDGGGHYAQLGFAPPLLPPSWWAGVSFVPSAVKGTIASLGGLSITYDNTGCFLTFSLQGAGSPSVLSLGIPVPNMLNNISVGYIAPGATSDLGIGGVYGLIIFALNGVVVSQMLVAPLITSTTWNVGSSSAVNAFSLINFVIKGEVLTNETQSGFALAPRPLCYKGQFYYQDTGSTANAFVRFDQALISTKCPYGFVGGTPDDLSSLQWTPLNQNFILKTGNMTFRPTLANFWKIEMTNLVAEPLSVMLPQIANSTSLFGPSAAAPEADSPYDQGAPPVGTSTQIAATQGQPMFTSTTPLPTPEPDLRLLSPTQTLVAPTPLAQQALATGFGSFGYIDWYQSPSMAVDGSGQSENYVDQTTNQIQQVGFYCGFYTIQALRSNIASQTDTPVYVESFLDQQNYNL